ncbi:MAG: sulfite exporter TauE/SafE family protein [Clostridia bacterium]|nr:sulfite exporter TauE/SafE family protein [Clostridia bacterium]
MIYLITFLEGIISFISPCMLPMIPIYLSYFAGDINKKRNTLINAISFVLGFTFVFCLLGIFAGTLGSLLKNHQTIINTVCGIIVILFGLNYLDLLHLKIFKPSNKRATKVTGVFSAFLFGIIFSINLTPCVGAFLGSALMMASVSGTMLKGTTLLLLYSLGLGIPIILSALLINKLNSVFTFIKKNYKIINVICGVFLILIGILMMFGIMNTFLYSFT